MYEIKGNGQVCSFDHALCLCERTEAAKSSEPQYERVAVGRHGKSLPDHQDTICDFQRRKDEGKYRIGTGSVKKSDQNREEDNIAAYFNNPFKTVHHASVKYREIKPVMHSAGETFR